MIGFLSEWRERDGSAPVLIDTHPDHPTVITRDDLWRRIAALRGELSERGVGPGDCIAVWLPNWSETLVWQFAAVSLGAHVIGINTRYNIDEVAHVLALARPVLVAIAHDFAGLDLGARLSAAVKSAGARPPSVAVITGPRRPAASSSEIARHDVGAGAWAPRVAGRAAYDSVVLADDRDMLAVAFTTSGSTGRPKLAAHKVSAVAGHAKASAGAGEWRDDSVTLLALPLTGVFAFVPAMATLATGGVCVLAPMFDAEATLADMERFGVTHFAAGDDVIARLIEAQQRRPRNLSRWRRLFIADFVGKAEQQAQWIEHQLGVTVAGCYGSSEVFALAFLQRPSTPLAERWRGGGLAVAADTEVRVRDPETGAALAPGEAGELQVRGAIVVDAYLGDPARRAAAMTADGWFRTGDLGTVAADGSVTFLCRIGDALRLKGFLVEPAEIESRLAAHAAVEICKVVGAHSADGATEAVAFVVLRAGAMATGAELVDWCAAALARYKVPTAVHIIAEMPVTVGVNGAKIKAAALREMAERLPW